MIGGLLGCESDRNNRLSLEVSRRAQVVDEYTEVSVAGGTFVTVEQAIVSDNNASILRFIARAESLQPTFQVRTTDCQPRVIHFSVNNVDESKTACRFSAFRQGEKALDIAGRQVLEPFGTTPTVGSVANGTYLVRPSLCQTESGEDGALRMSVCVDWSTGRTEVRAGHVAYEDCFDTVPRATCLEQTSGGEPAVTSATLEAEIVLDTASNETLVIAAIANLQPNETMLRTLAEDLRREDVDFVVVVGDLTENGSVSEAEQITGLLNQYLTIPWFATLGDKDVDGNLGGEYLGLFGSASSAFDVEGVRIVLLDSANGGLKEPDELLDTWLSDKGLTSGETVPVQHLVFTHYPPFSTSGGTRPQFDHTFEAGALMARLTSIQVLGMVVGQREHAGVEQIGSVRIFHTGKLANTDRGAWSKFTMDRQCIARCNETQGLCDCLVYDRMPQ